jgi:hypothetical protein
MIQGNIFARLETSLSNWSWKWTVLPSKKEGPTLKTSASKLGGGHTCLKTPISKESSVIQGKRFLALTYA